MTLAELWRRPLTAELWRMWIFDRGRMEAKSCAALGHEQAETERAMPGNMAVVMRKALPLGSQVVGCTDGGLLPCAACLHRLPAARTCQPAQQSSAVQRCCLVPAGG